MFCAFADGGKGIQWISVGAFRIEGLIADDRIVDARPEIGGNRRLCPGLLFVGIAQTAGKADLIGDLVGRFSKQGCHLVSLVENQETPEIGVGKLSAVGGRSQVETLDQSAQDAIAVGRVVAGLSATPVKQCFD